MGLLREATNDLAFAAVDLVHFIQLLSNTPYLQHSVLAIASMRSYLAEPCRHSNLLRAAYLQNRAISLAKPIYCGSLPQEESVGMLYFSSFAAHFSFAEGAVTATAERDASDSVFSPISESIEWQKFYRQAC